MIKKSFLLAICILAITFIFFNSSQDGAVSHNLSTYVTEVVADKISFYIKGSRSLINSLDLNTLDKIMRKFAHTFEFMILAIMLTFSFNALKVKRKKILFFTLMIVLCVACSDETLQIFIPDRTASVIDVCIDFCGGIVGYLLSSFIIVIRNIITKLYQKTQTI